MILSKHCERLYEELIAELERIGLETAGELKMRELSIWACIRHLDKLKDFFKSNPPSGEEEEIIFFRDIKPKFKAMLLYHQMLYHIECRKPASVAETLIEYYQKEQRNIIRFFEINTSFQQYLRSCSGHLDKLYFLRGRIDIRLHPFEGFVDLDPEFNTSHDNNVAQLIAYEMLLKKLGAMAENARTASPMREGYSGVSRPVKWTNSKSGLIELLYSLHETKSIDNGDISLKRLASIFEQTFNISLGNFYDTFDWIAGRPKQTTFIDELKHALVARIGKKLK